MNTAQALDLVQQIKGLGTTTIGFSGGEPLLREDILPIIEAFSGHGMSVNLCTNGIFLEDHAEALCRSGATARCVGDGWLDGASPAVDPRA